MNLYIDERETKHDTLNVLNLFDVGFNYIPFPHDAVLHKYFTYDRRMQWPEWKYRLSEPGSVAWNGATFKLYL